MVTLSVLDAAPITEGASIAEALTRSADLARHAERLGYRRFWVTEHHNMPNVASAAPAVLIAHLAAATTTIRIGAGGVMLPHHSPLVVAEQFGTLDALFPGRIDLGLGRASGSDAAAARALRRDLLAADRHEREIKDVLDYLWDRESVRGVTAIPGHQSHIPVWILGSSTTSAALAAALGCPFAFASHFRPAQLMPAIDTYRETFQPSLQLKRPRLMLGINVIAADSDDDAHCLASSMQRAAINAWSGRREPLCAPTPNYVSSLPANETAVLDEVLRHSAIGCAATIREQLEHFVGMTCPDELIVSSVFFDHAACLRSFDILARAWPPAAH